MTTYDAVASADPRSKGSSLWFARLPTLPPSEELGPTVAISEPSRFSVAVWVIGALVGVVLVVAGAASRHVGLLVTGAVMAVGAMVTGLTARRGVIAAGSDWLYVRNGLVGEGKWASIDELTSVKLKQGNGTALVCIKAQDGFVIRMSANPTSTPLRKAVSQVLLSLNAQKCPESERQLLSQWSGSVTP